MSEDVFTEPEESSEDWVDVRMTDPAEGEWDIDAVVVGGQVEYIDLQIRPDVVSGFVECLVDDVSDERAGEVLATVAKRQGIDLSEHVDEE